LACNGDDEGKPKASAIKIISMTPASPATLKYYKTDDNDHVRIVYNYSVVEPDGVRIWIEPLSTTASNYDIFYSPSKVYTGEGTNSVIVAVKCDEEKLVIDKLILTIFDPKAQVSTKDSVDVNYTFTK